MSVIDDLKKLSAAEDFFRYLDVPFEQGIINVSRLHILKRIGQTLGAGKLDGMADDEARKIASALLKEAHDEFSGKSGVEARLFKILKERDPNAPKGAFVSFDSLFEPLPTA